MKKLPYLLLALSCWGQTVSKVWVADQGDGTYKNPVIHADYSDPDVVRVGIDFYLTASSFNAVPGLPILHSTDLVNWELIGHVFPAQPPLDVFDKPRHGGGVWAPAIRFHNGQFYVFYPDPDIGIYMVKAKNPGGPWSTPLLIKAAKGWIDPCPLWDADGKAYLVSAMAASRSGIKSVLVVSRMSPDGTKLLDDGVMVFDGHVHDPTVEGPKFYKRNGYYYIFAPAGGVATGWQLALRSKNIYGPYERRVVLSQGKTAINGPHQGAWVDTQGGESWFLHFQDAGAYGRIVHLQPMKWVDDWPVIGTNGEPVLTSHKPRTAKPSAVMTPPDSDEFESPAIGRQWQWHANPQPGWALPSVTMGVLRLFAIPVPVEYRNFWDVPNLLLQKFPAPEFTATAKLTLSPYDDQDQVGLIVMGLDYSRLSANKKQISLSGTKNADRGTTEALAASIPNPGGPLYLRVKVSQNAICMFSYSSDGINFASIGAPFTARPGRWIGAKVGLFAVRNGRAPEYGYADVDWFRIEK